MTLDVEDGTGKDDADAFVSQDDFESHCGARGYDLTSYQTGNLIEQAIRRGTTYLSDAFKWQGYKLNGRAQALAWPRTDVVDTEDLAVASDEVPSEIVRATCEAAWYELQNPGGLSPVVDMTKRKKRVRVEGAVDVEYAYSAASADAARPVVLAIRDIVAGLTSSTSNTLVGSAVRV